MMQEAYNRAVKGFSLIPLKYYLGAAGAVILLLCYGIARTAVSPVTVAKSAKAEAVKPADALVPPRTPAAIPAAIAEGNLFRRQRRDFAPPKTLAETGDEPVPEIKLLGLIITDERRIAIVDAEVKKYFKREVAPDLVISGIKQAQPADDGRFYEVVPLPGKGEKLASQTFNEGDVIANYRLNRVNDTSIEVSSLASGKRTEIYLMEADEASRSLETAARHVKPVPLRGPDISAHGSGAVTP